MGLLDIYPDSYCNITAGDFIPTYPGGWRTIINVDIGNGDDCPNGWCRQNETGINFCHL